MVVSAKTKRRWRVHPVSVVAFLAMAGCVLAANWLNCWSLAVDFDVIRKDGLVELPRWQYIGWPNPCIDRMVYTSFRVDRTQNTSQVCDERVEYNWSFSRALLVNLAFIVLLPLGTAIVVERMIRNWRWPIQFRLSTILWAVSAAAVVLASFKAEAQWYAGRGDGPIATLDPWVRGPVLLGCLCSLYMAAILVGKAVGRLCAVCCQREDVAQSVFDVGLNRMDQPDETPENPYRSPESVLEPGKKTVKQVLDGVAGAAPRKRGCLQFVLHMLIASFLAPGAGAAAMIVLSADQPDTPLLGLLVSAVIAGPLLVFFIWFIVVPFGIVTYAICLVLSESRVANRYGWAFGGMLLGLAFGAFMALFMAAPDVLPLTGIGGAVGLVTGLLLRQVWFFSPKDEGS